MSVLVETLDEGTNKNTGESNHPQESWQSNNFEDSLSKLYFQLIRTNDHSLLSHQYEKLIYENIYDKDKIKLLISLLFQTRDIFNGKGEYGLFYELLPIWDKYLDYIDVDLIKKPLMMLVSCRQVGDNYLYYFKEPYGSFKDIKYLFNSFKKYYNFNKKDIIQLIEKNGILKFLIDIIKCEFGYHNSLIYKWLPREKSKKFGWQASIFASILNPGLPYKSALVLYRKECANNNKLLNTVQINQCNNTWSFIDFEKDLTSLTFLKQKNVFLNNGRNHEAKFTSDRIFCKDTFQLYLESKRLKVKHIPLGEIIKNMISALNPLDIEMVKLLNKIWNEKLNENNSVFYNTIPILDISISMCVDNCPFYQAIGIALWIACKSDHGKRLIVFDQEATWLNLDECENLSDMIKILNKFNLSNLSDVYSAFKIITDVCLYKNISPTEICNYKIILLSDMQFDQNKLNSDSLIFNQYLNQLFKEAGLKTLHRSPYITPTLIYWNFRTTIGFPTSTHLDNCIMLSGYNQNLLSLILKEGANSIKNINSRKSVLKILNSKRYSWFW